MSYTATLCQTWEEQLVSDGLGEVALLQDDGEHVSFDHNFGHNTDLGTAIADCESAHDTDAWKSVSACNDRRRLGLLPHPEISLEEMHGRDVLFNATLADCISNNAWLDCDEGDEPLVEMRQPCVSRHFRHS